MEEILLKCQGILSRYRTLERSLKTSRRSVSTQASTQMMMVFIGVRGDDGVGDDDDQLVVVMVTMMIIFLLLSEVMMTLVMMIMIFF